MKEGEGKRPNSIATRGAWAGRGEAGLNPGAGAPLPKWKGREKAWPDMQVLFLLWQWEDRGFSSNGSNFLCEARSKFISWMLKEKGGQEV